MAQARDRTHQSNYEEQITMYYQAKVMFDVFEDDYKDGEATNSVNWWIETLTAKTTDELKTKIENSTYSKFSDDTIERDEVMDTDEVTAYRASYMTDQDNEDEPTEFQLEQWKQGQLKLYAVNCNIRVSKVIETKVEL